MSRWMMGAGGLLLVVLAGIVLGLPDPPRPVGIEQVEQGHAALEADDLGMALWHYKQALTAIPRDPAAQLGAAIVRALRTDILPEESGLWADLTRLTADVMSVDELGWLTLMLWTGTFGAAGWWVIRQPNPRLRRVTVILGAVTLLMLGLLIVRRVYEYTQPPAVITAFETYAYAAPDQDVPILFKVYSGAEGRILERREGWVRIHLPDNREGWVQEQAMRLE